MATELEAQGQLHSLLWGNQNISAPTPADFAPFADAFLSEPIGVPAFSVATPAKQSFLDKIWTGIKSPFQKTYQGVTSEKFVGGIGKGIGQSLNSLMLQKLGLTPKPEVINTQGETVVNYDIREKAPRGQQAAYQIPDWMMFWQKKPDADREPARITGRQAAGGSVVVVGVVALIAYLLAKK